jgi:hypothetical protein
MTFGRPREKEEGKRLNLYLSKQTRDRLSAKRKELKISRSKFIDRIVRPPDEYELTWAFAEHRCTDTIRVYAPDPEGIHHGVPFSYSPTALMEYEEFLSRGPTPEQQTAIKFWDEIGRYAREHPKAPPPEFESAEAIPTASLESFLGHH